MLSRRAPVLEWAPYPDRITFALYPACVVVCDNGSLVWICETSPDALRVARLTSIRVVLVVLCACDLPAAGPRKAGAWAPATPAALTARHWLPGQGSAALAQDPKLPGSGFQGKPTWDPTFCQLFGADHAASWAGAERMDKYRPGPSSTYSTTALLLSHR